MKRSVKKASNRVVNPQPYIGYQWGEPPNGESSFLVNRVESRKEGARTESSLESPRGCDATNCGSCKIRTRPIVAPTSRCTNRNL